jgi:60 kDa SS-A/Ro ribonucleoprotein
VLFEVVHPESPMSGTLKLMVQDTEPLHNIRQTLNDIGIGTSFVFRYNGCLISSTKSLRDITYDPTKKIYLGAGVEPVEPVQPLSVAAVPSVETTQEPKKKQPREDPLTGAARFLKSLLAISETAKDTGKAIIILKQNPRLQREHIPTEHMSSSAIWDVLLEGMGMEALIRNLGKLSQIGLAAQKRAKICEMLTNAENVRRSRVHPLKIFIGSKTYGAGKGDLGKMTWPVVPEIANTLTQTFKLAFGNVSKSGKRMMIALDVSGSMDSPCAGAANVTCREGETALALVQVAVEGTANVYIRGFTNTFFNFDGKIRPEMTIQDAIRATSAPFGATDCALPMVTALKDRTPVDVFVVYTDSETYAPTVHPQVALEQYRKEMGIDAKLIVVGMVSNCLSIADPSDRNILNLAGFDTATPELISMFSRGEI